RCDFIHVFLPDRHRNACGGSCGQDYSTAPNRQDQSRSPRLTFRHSTSPKNVRTEENDRTATPRAGSNAAELPEHWMNDELLLRRIARESIEKGVLPSHSPQQTWGGPGTGLTCALCGASVDRDELEFEVEFGRDRYHLHRACF